MVLIDVKLSGIAIIIISLNNKDYNLYIYNTKTKQKIFVPINRGI